MSDDQINSSGRGSTDFGRHGEIMSSILDILNFKCLWDHLIATNVQNAVWNKGLSWQINLTVMSNRSYAKWTREGIHNDDWRLRIESKRQQP